MSYEATEWAAKVVHHDGLIEISPGDRAWCTAVADDWAKVPSVERTEIVRRTVTYGPWAPAVTDGVA